MACLRVDRLDDSRFLGFEGFGALGSAVDEGSGRSGLRGFVPSGLGFESSRSFEFEGLGVFGLLAWMIRGDSSF